MLHVAARAENGTTVLRKATREKRAALRGSDGRRGTWTPSTSAVAAPRLQGANLPAEARG